MLKIIFCKYWIPIYKLARHVCIIKKWLNCFIRLLENSYLVCLLEAIFLVEEGAQSKFFTTGEGFPHSLGRLNADSCWYIYTTMIIMYHNIFCFVCFFSQKFWQVNSKNCPSKNFSESLVNPLRPGFHFYWATDIKGSRRIYANKQIFYTVFEVFPIFLIPLWLLQPNSKIQKHSLKLFLDKK